jgi:hypothetical protein
MLVHKMSHTILIPFELFDRLQYPFISAVCRHIMLQTFSKYFIEQLLCMIQILHLPSIKTVTYNNRLNVIMYSAQSQLVQLCFDLTFCFLFGCF